MARVSNHADPPVVLPWFEIHPIRGFGTTRAPGRRIRQGDAGNSTLPPVLSDSDGGAVDLRSGYRTSGRPRVPGPRSWPGKGLSGPGGVTFPAPLWPIPPRCGSSPTRSSR